MSSEKKLRMNLNGTALTKVASLISNSVLLSANVYLIGSNVSSQFKEKKRERKLQTLELCAQVANATAGLTKVVVEIIDSGQTSKDV